MLASPSIDMESGRVSRKKSNLAPSQNLRFELETVHLSAKMGHYEHRKKF